MSGFDSLKDVIEVLIIPLVIFGLGIWLPKLFENQKRNTFINLIRREIREMTPFPTLQQMQNPEKTPQVKDKMEGITGRWPEHLTKRFVHEQIFNNVSDNRDFILSLPPDLIYHLSQLWIEFGKVKEIVNPEDKDLNISAQEWNKHPDLKAHTIQWRWYLWNVCHVLDEYAKTPSFSEENKQNTLHQKIFEEWDKLLHHYYPDFPTLKETQKTS